MRWHGLCKVGLGVGVALASSATLAAQTLPPAVTTTQAIVTQPAPAQPAPKADLAKPAPAAPGTLGSPITEAPKTTPYVIYDRGAGCGSGECPTGCGPDGK